MVASGEQTLRQKSKSAMTDAGVCSPSMRDAFRIPFDALDFCYLLRIDRLQKRKHALGAIARVFDWTSFIGLSQRTFIDRVDFLAPRILKVRLDAPPEVRTYLQVDITIAALTSASLNCKQRPPIIIGCLRRDLREQSQV
jgi:hypothetical protein